MSDRDNLRAFPPRMQLLGRCLRGPLAQLRGTLAAGANGVHPVADMLGRIREETAAMTLSSERLARAVDRLMRDVVAREAATDPDVYRAVGAFESDIDDLCERLRSISRCTASDADRPALDALVGCWRHVLAETEAWLSELIDTLADPTAALARRGLNRPGPVELTLALTLTSPPALQALNRWIEERRQQQEQIEFDLALDVDIETRKSRKGCAGSVGWLVVGVGLIGVALGGGDGG